MEFNWKFLSQSMEKKRLTDQDLAFELYKRGIKIHASSVSHWRNGNNEPHFIKVAAMADIFGVSMEDFVKVNKN